MRKYPRDDEVQSLPEYGINANVIKTKEFDLAAARDLVCYEMGGSCIWCTNAEESGTIDMDAWIDIRLTNQQRDPIRFKLGTYISNVPFSRFFVSHDAQANKTLKIMYAREETDNIRILNPAINFANINTVQTVGTIERDESSWYDTLNNENTFVGGGATGGVGGQFSHVQLWNPAASGVCAILKKANGRPSGASNPLELRHHNAALANVLASGNKYIGEAAPDCQVRGEANVANLGTLMAGHINENIIYSPVKFIESDALVIPEGFGVCIECVVAGVNLYCSFEWIEVAA